METNILGVFNQSVRPGECVWEEEGVRGWVGGSRVNGDV